MEDGRTMKAITFAFTVWAGMTPLPEEAKELHRIAIAAWERSAEEVDASRAHVLITSGGKIDGIVGALCRQGYKRPQWIYPASCGKCPDGSEPLRMSIVYRTRHLGQQRGFVYETMLHEWGHVLYRCHEPSGIMQAYPRPERLWKVGDKPE